MIDLEKKIELQQKIITNLKKENDEIKKLNSDLILEIELNRNSHEENIKKIKKLMEEANNVIEYYSNALAEVNNLKEKLNKDIKEVYLLKKKYKESFKNIVKKI